METPPDMLEDLDPLLSPAQVAGMLGVTVIAARKRIREGVFPSVKMGKQNRVRKSVLKAYIESLPDRVVPTHTNGHQKGAGHA